LPNKEVIQREINYPAADLPAVILWQAGLTRYINEIFISIAASCGENNP
jgi:hypothetical protein